MPQGARPQVVRPRGGRAQRGPSHDLYDSGPRDGGFQSHTPSGPRFPPRGDRFSPMQTLTLHLHPDYEMEFL